MGNRVDRFSLIMPELKDGYWKRTNLTNLNLKSWGWHFKMVFSWTIHFFVGRWRCLYLLFIAVDRFKDVKYDSNRSVCLWSRSSSVRSVWVNRSRTSRWCSTQDPLTSGSRRPTAWAKRVVTSAHSSSVHVKTGTQYECWWSDVGSLCSSLGTAMHRKFKAFESSTYTHDGRVFGIHYGSGHMLGVMARDELKVSVHHLP